MTRVVTSQYQSVINTLLWTDEAESVTIFVDLFMPHPSVMVWRMMFGKMIRFVDFACSQVNEEVSLACSILDPI